MMTLSIQDMLYNYAAEGWHLFPVGRDKKPLTEHGFKDATQTQAGINEYLQRYPGCQWGGYFPGQLILDIDVKNNGFASLAKLEDTYGKLPPTRTHKTGSGGRHYIYR